MRLLPVFALMTSALSLAACAGGGDTLSAAGMVASVNSVCGVNQSNCRPVGPTPPAPAVPDSDGDGIPDDVDTDGTGGSGGGGNTTNLSVGNRTLAMQNMVWTSPTEAAFARARLTSNAGDMAATEAAIMSANKPTTLMMETDTNAANNGQFATPVAMNGDLYGTRDLRWLGLGHIDPSVTSTDITDQAGNVYAYDSGSNSYRLVGGYGTEPPADMGDDYLWNQVVGFMGSKANGGIGADYREYSIVSSVLNRDEVLQVWAWDDSYTAQWQNQSGGGTPKQQAWSFGGRATTNMPVGGSATYRGRFVGTAETSNWIKPDTADINPNAAWMVQGSSQLTANFANNQVTGNLTAETWTSYQDALKGWYTWTTAAAGPAVPGNIAGSPSVPTPIAPNYAFYASQLRLEGTIVPGDTANLNNSIVGTATYAGDVITNDNPMVAGFFGNNASEITGVFTATGTMRDPRGGSTGLNDARRAFVTINGSFNADCTTDGTCAP